MNKIFDDLETFLRTNYTEDALIGKTPETKYWRVEIFKHNKTGRFFPTARSFTLRPAKFRNLIKSGFASLGLIDNDYVSGDSFSVLRFPTGNEEMAKEICFSIAERYFDHPLLALPLNHPYRFRDLPEELISIIDGALAGDGCISQNGKINIFNFSYGCATKYRGHVEEMAALLQNYGCPNNVRDYITSSSKTSVCYPNVNKMSCVNWSLPCLKKHRNRWYSESGKKKLPEDVRNNHLFWRWFYAGDGSLCTEYNGKFSIKIFSNDFTKTEVDRLSSMLEKHGIRSAVYQSPQVTKQGESQFILRIGVKDTVKFLNFIGKPIKDLEYKWSK